MGIYFKNCMLPQTLSEEGDEFATYGKKNRFLVENNCKMSVFRLF